MNPKVKLLNEKMLDILSSNPEQTQLKKSLKTGQRVVLSYHLSSDVKKKITGIVIKKNNANKPYATLRVLGGDTKIQRYEKIVCLYSPQVEILQVFPAKNRHNRANLGYLMHVNSIRSSI